ncbi:MAG TPA: hypothetical protein VMS37_01590 [Verrucomicrobiae bacterium]|nr:hypothetical protein [Verrucomicrobiae bacterium]
MAKKANQDGTYDLNKAELAAVDSLLEADTATIGRVVRLLALFKKKTTPILARAVDANLDAWESAVQSAPKTH